jgi:hypothetical protein
MLLSDDYVILGVIKSIIEIIHKKPFYVHLNIYSIIDETEFQQTKI